MWRDRCIGQLGVFSFRPSLFKIEGVSSVFVAGNAEIVAGFKFIFVLMFTQYFADLLERSGAGPEWYFDARCCCFYFVRCTLGLFYIFTELSIDLVVC